MLKGIDRPPGPDLLATLPAMGHRDEIAIVDAEYPAKAHARRLMRMDGHGAPRLVDAVLSVMPLDADVPEAAVAAREPGFSLVPIAGQGFSDRVRAAYAIVAGGEHRPYGTIILRKDMVRPEEDSA